MASIRWDHIPSPIIQRGNAEIAHRDAAIHFHDGAFRVFYGMAFLRERGRVQFQLAVTESSDLIEWTEPRTLTPGDDDLNFTDPGNIVRHDGEWIMTVETYRTPFSPSGGGETARSWMMRSDDLESWSDPELMRLKGPDVNEEKMGRCISPCLFPDRHEAGKWWCFFKHGGVTLHDSRGLAYGDGGLPEPPRPYALLGALNMSYSYDLKNWTWFARTDSEENYCVLVEEDGYLLIDSPYNGVGVRMSSDLIHWHEVGLYTLGQREWPWAQGRLSAAHVIDLRTEPDVGKYVMVFHGCSREGKAASNIHGAASLAIAWSDDLANWYWPEPGSG